MSRYLIILETTATGFSSYAPDLPGCVATGATLEETQRAMCAAIDFHIGGLCRIGEQVPLPTSSVAYCDAAARR